MVRQPTNCQATQNGLQLSSTELEMIKEVFQIFSKYTGVTREFGVQLVHSHFALEEGEILYETHDKENRILSVRPARLGQFKNPPLATAWQQEERGQIEVAMFCCDRPGTV
jgi:hypothetical protein